MEEEHAMIMFIAFLFLALIAVMVINHLERKKVNKLMHEVEMHIIRNKPIHRRR